MPEITDSQQREYATYTALGTPEELKKLRTDFDKLKEEAAERRKENKALTDEVAAQKAKTPDGAVILAGDEATAYQAVQAAGLTLKDVDTKLKERDTLATEKATREREDLVRAGIKGEGWANEDDVLRSLSGRKDFDALKLERQEREVDVTVNGKPEKQKKTVVIVTPEGGTAQQLGEWFKASDPLGYAAASGAKSTTTNGVIRETALQATTATSGGSGKAALEAAKKRNDERATAPNALRPAATT